MTTFTRPHSFRAGAVAVCVSTALMMGGCGPKNKGAVPIISVEKTPSGLAGLADSEFAKYFALTPRGTPEAEAQEALAAFGLTESGKHDLKWSNEGGGAGNYVFLDMESTSDEDALHIDRAEFFGVRMLGGEATFDRADFEGLKFTDTAMNLKIEAMSLAGPTPDTAKAIVESLAGFGDDTNLDFGDGAAFGLSGLSVKTIDLAADDVTGTIDQIVWGADAAAKRANLKIANIDLSLPQRGSDIASLLSLKDFSAKNYKTEGLSESFATIMSGSPDGLTTMLSGLMRAGQSYDTVTLDSLKFDNNIMTIDLPKIEATADGDAAITTYTQVIAPTTVTMKAGAAGETRPLYNLFQQLGYDSITFKNSQTMVINRDDDTIEVKDGILDLTDGFRLNYTYIASGFAALTAPVDDDAAQTDNTPASAKLNGMTLSLKDESIVERGLKLGAQIRDTDPESAKKELRAVLTLASAFPGLVARSDLEKDVLKKIAGPLVDFIDDGGTLTLQLAPKRPIPISAFENLETIAPEDLGFSASQTP